MRLRALFSISCVGLAVACDSGDGPPPSLFSAEDTYSRAVVGRVFAGAELAPGATVRIDPKVGYAADEKMAAVTDRASWLSSTDPTGIYKFQAGPLRYDLAVGLDREITVFEDLAFRYCEPSLPPTLPLQGFSAPLDVVTDPPPRPGSALAFFVSGFDARAVVERSDGSRELVFRRFTSQLRIHAVEYSAKDGLVAPIGEGFADVRVQAGQTLPVVIPMAAIVPPVSEIVLDAPPPEGFTASPVEIMVDFGVVTDARKVITLPAGAPFRFGRMGGARYLVHARATRSDGAISDSGFVGVDFDLELEEIMRPSRRLAVPLPAPATAIPRGPAEAGAIFIAAGGGVYEHVFTPVSGSGATLRVITGGDATLPDASRVGLPRPVGLHRWTVTRWAELERVEELAGPDARVRAGWATGPALDVELR